MKIESIFIKVPVDERLPELDKFVPAIDESGCISIYRRVSFPELKEEWLWDIRDNIGINSPNCNLKITHWLEEHKLMTAIKSACEHHEDYYFKDEDGGEHCLKCGEEI